MWLASFPRSGNTFLRIVLERVYGIRTGEYHTEGREAGGVSLRVLARPDDSAIVVKTHLLPEEVQSAPAAYLVRDGRDAVVSLAHHRRDLRVSSSDLVQNMREATAAAGDSFFGGWSRHVSRWRPRAAVLIRFEELIADPLGTAEALRGLLDLPPPLPDRVPSFAELKTRDCRFGVYPWGHLFFRRGQLNSWRDEMPKELHDMYWELHGETMAALGYDRDGQAAVDRCEAARARAAC